MNKKTGVFRNVHDVPKHLLNTFKVTFTEETFPSDMGIQYQYNKFVVSLSALEPVSFDLNIPEDQVFLTEIAAVRDIVKRLAIHGPFTTLIDDDVPDFFSFSFSGLQLLKEKYGEQSQKLVVAMRLLDEFLSEIVSDLNRLYQSRLVTEILFQDKEVYPKLSSECLKVLRNYLMSSSDLQLTFPNIYLTRGISLSERNRLCESLQNNLENAVAVCGADNFVEHQFLHRGFNDISNASNSTNSTGFTNDQIAAFNISLWFSLFLFFSMLAGIYAMMTIGWAVTSDSLLFKQSRRYYKQE